MKLYIETSVINHLFANDTPERVEITQKFFERSSKEHSLCISDVVLLEIDKASKHKKNLLNGVINAIKFQMIKITEDTKNIQTMLCIL